MNHRIDPRADDEREWQAQERALCNERAGAPADDDPLLARYRLVARALLQRLPDELPQDFARQLAMRVASHRFDTRFEQRLMHGLAMALALSGTVMAVLHGQAWLQAVAGLLPTQVLGVTANWTLVLVACLGTSWVWGQLHERLGSHLT